MSRPNSATIQPASRSTPAGAARRVRPDVAVLIFLTLVGSYAYFWQSRDWNTASRLMLTYALVDRQLVEIDGLERQTGDLARFGGHYYTDKAPGLSFLGALVHSGVKLAGDLPDHPLDDPFDPRPAVPYWPADYWVTLLTSGVLTAGLGVVLYAFALRLGATHWAGAVVGLGYGLGTPAFVYATLFYGHQAAAFCLVTAFFLLYRAAHERRANLWHMLLAGLLAGYAVVIEYQAAGISAVLALYATAAIRRMGPIVTFLVAAALGGSLLLAYNYRAFGDAFDMGYAHEVSREFAAVHSADNPLGLRLPNWEAARQVLVTILWGRYRGAAFYAPLLVAAPLGVIALVCRRYWGVAAVVIAACAWMLAVNVGYPKWEGGWCTGPRLVVPALPFAALALAGLLGVDRFGLLAILAGAVAAAGAALILACVAVGGRFPIEAADPVLQIVLPHWRGSFADLPVEIAGGRQFEWNIGRWLVENGLPADTLPPEPSEWQGLQMAPLALFWLIMLALVAWRSLARGDTAPRT